MKKNWSYFFLALFVLSCSTRKKENTSSFMKGFSAYYNTLFNGKEALESELTSRTKAHKDNFYGPYLPIFTFKDLPAQEDDQPKPLFSNTENMGPGVPEQNETQTKSTTALEIAEAKALKAISKYSVLKKGEEKNSQMFDAHILLAQSRLYQNKTVEALDALNYIFTNMKKDKRLPLAKIYEGLAYTNLKNYSEANRIFADLKKNKISSDDAKLLSVLYAEMLLKSGNKDQAISELATAYDLNKNRTLRSRIAYLRGQILASQDKNVEARESFVSAYKNAANFEFEVKSQIEIAKTFSSKDNFETGKKYLENISKKGTYDSRKNEFYFALGLMANKAGKKDEARIYFDKALKEKVSDSQIRGYTYEEIGKSMLQKDDYIGAGAYFDSALVAMTYQPEKTRLQGLTTNIKKISTNFYLIKKNDSILALTKMNDAQRNSFFSKYITDLKAKESKIELERKREERSKGFETGDYKANSIFAGNKDTFQDFSDNSNGSFYFGNQNTVTKGSSSFKQIWGDRALADNWRFSAKTNSLQDLKDVAMGTTSTPNPRRFEPSFYIEKIPTDAAFLAGLKKDRDTASLGLGRMYDNFFANTPLATKTLYDLVDVNPVEDVKLQALYHIFYMNYEKNPTAAERAKNILINDYPYTSYAEFARNPRNKVFTKSSEEAEKAYRDAYDLYKNEKYNDSKNLIDVTIAKYPKDVLVPKFALLNAFNSGKTSGKEVMILQLEQIALNYGKTDEGKKAKDMLNYLKSEVHVQLTDAKGNVISDPKNPTPQVEQGVPTIEEVNNLQIQQEEQMKREELEMNRKMNSKTEDVPPKRPTQDH